MQQEIYVQDVMTELVLYVGFAIVVCLFFLFYECKFLLKHKNKQIDEKLKRKHQNDVVSVLFTFIPCWAFGLIILMNVLGANSWKTCIPFFIVACGLIYLALQLRKK